DLPFVACQQFADHLFEIHPSVLEDWLRPLGEDEQFMLLEGAFRSVMSPFHKYSKLTGTKHARSYLDRLGEIPTQEFDSNTLHDALAVIAVAEPALLDGYLRRLLPSQRIEAEKRISVAKLMRQAEEDFPGAMQAAANAGPLADGLLTSLAYQLSLQDPGTVADWLGQLKDPALRTRTESAVLSSVSWHPFEERERFLFTFLQRASEPEAFLSAVKQLASDYAADSEAARGFINRLPAGQLRAAAAEALAGQWAKVNPAAAARWIQTLNGYERDVATRELVTHIAEAPESAFEWAASIRDPAERLRAAQRVVRTWRDVDAPAIAGWLNESAFSEEEKALLAADCRAEGGDNERCR
nr:hypothetical protein [Verrucomicrobiota bacterium]